MARVTAPCYAWHLMNLPELRQQFPVCERLAYLNHAAVSPLPLRCQRHVREYLDELGHYGAANYPGMAWGAIEKVRSLAAQLLDTATSRIFFVRSTTQGLGIAATGVPCGPGDNVVLVEKEFPANLRPFLPLRRRGAELRFVPQREGRVLLEDLAAALDRRTRLLSISHVQFLSGFRADLEAIGELRRRQAPDALFVVDAIQALGVFAPRVEAAGVDLLSADSHKWLLGPEGVGIGYCSPRGLERIQPALEGWLSVRDPFDFFDLDQPLKDTAARFEDGAYNLAGIHGLQGSLELLAAVGQPALERRVIELTDYAAERLRARSFRILSPRANAGEKSGILLADRAGLDVASLAPRLRAAGIIVSFRGGALRIAPHGYNTEQEIDRLLSELPE